MQEFEKSNNTRSRRKWLIRLGVPVIVLALASTIHVWTHPLIFNESFFSHAHCIPQTGLALRQYAMEHGGFFPAHTNGYGDALLLLLAEGSCASYSLTGPGYDSGVFDRALTNHSDVPEIECGRVYIQGLTETMSPDLAILFDKLPNPGDHTHFLSRIRHPLGREVCFLDGHFEFVPENRWAEFTHRQIELLVSQGLDRAKAEALYAEKGKTP